MHIKLRNRLGIEKGSKLITILKALKKNKVNQTKHEIESL